MCAGLLDDAAAARYEATLPGTSDPGNEVVAPTADSFIALLRRLVLECRWHLGERRNYVSQPDLQQVKQALLDAGLEVYRVVGDEIQIAERIRLHIMDSGVRVRIGEGIDVTFTARSQRSDFPTAAPDELFARVRASVGGSAGGRGYSESQADMVTVKDPVDDAKVLDTWHEVTYRKATSDVADAIAEVRWALEVEKYVTV
jgi:hypothetical protein